MRTTQSTQVHLYVRQADVPLWEQAEAEAKRRGVPLSVLVADALRVLLESGGEMQD